MSTERVPMTIEGAVAGIDGGDLVRLATALENTGGLGAFDVTTTVTLPADFAFLNGSLALANLQVRRGDGTLLVAGTDYSVSGNEITFLDPGVPNQPSLLPGRLPDPLLDRWDYRAEESAGYTVRDRSAIYGGVHLYTLR